MADTDTPEAAKAETRGQMVQRHKRELAQVKKTRGVNKKDLQKLEADMRERHAKEEEEFDKVRCRFLEIF